MYDEAGHTKFEQKIYSMHADRLELGGDFDDFRPIRRDPLNNFGILRYWRFVVLVLVLLGLLLVTKWFILTSVIFVTKMVKKVKSD